MRKRMDRLTAPKSCLHRVKIWWTLATNSGIYGDGLATIYAQHARNRQNAFDAWVSYSTTDGTSCWTDLRQIHTEDVFSPSLGPFGMSRSKVKGQDHQGQKTRCSLTIRPQYGLNGTASLQITSRKQQTHRFDRWRWVSLPACLRACAGPGGLPLGSATHF